VQSWMMGVVAGIISTGWWPALPSASLSFGFIALAFCSLLWRSPAAWFVCGLACGCALGLMHGNDLLQSRIVKECVGVPLTVTGRVASLPNLRQMGDGAAPRQQILFAVEELWPARCAGPKKLSLSYYGKVGLQAGEAWQFEVKLKKPWGLANPGSFNLQVWFAQEAIDAVGSIRDSGLTRQLPSSGSLYAMHHRLRQRISERIAELALDHDVIAMLQAMTVADNSGIEPPLWRLCQQYGINHLLVISGSHIVFVAGIGYLLGGVYTRIFPGTGGLRVPQVLALFLACLYGALAGFSIPVQRALFMLGCFVAASLTGRGSGSLHNLLLAATAVLLVNPLAALGSGFWLSFSAVAVLLWLARWQQGMGLIQRLLRTHGYMSLVMLGLGALLFGGGSVVAMFANLLMIPLVGLVVVPLSLLAIVCFLSGWPLASTLWHLAGWPLQQLLPPANALATWSNGRLFLPLTADLAQALLAVLAVALLILPGRAAMKLLALLLALPALLPPAPPSPSGTLETQVTVLDVGQGTAVVIRSGDRALLYDTGGGDPVGTNMGVMAVLPYLRQRGISRLDTLVISHPDLDHSAGTGVILDAMGVARFRYGGSSPETGRGRPCVAGESWRWPGGQEFQFLSPAREIAHRTNDSSCVLQVRVGSYKLLLPGDIEEERERTLVRYWGQQLRSDWLLTAHHGSQTSSSLTFLKQVQPQVAVISSGYANRFGHPHPKVLERLYQQQRLRTLLTAKEGALEFTVAPGQTIKVIAHRKLVRRYWM
jgi:competence protein ComEC